MMNVFDRLGSEKALNEAKTLLRSGSRMEACRLAAQAAELDPQNEEAWLIQAALAEPNESLAFLQKALQVNPASERARKGMDWARQRLQQEEIHNQFISIANKAVTHPLKPVPEIKPWQPATTVQEVLPDLPLPTLQIRSGPVTDEELWQIDVTRIITPGRSAYDFIQNGFFTAYHQISITGIGMGEVHPHTFRLQVLASVEEITRNNLVVISYESIRSVVERICQTYEGKTLNELPPFRDLQPTAENLVGVIAQQLEKLTLGKKYRIYEITLMESPTVGVVYRNMNIVRSMQ